MKTDDEIFESLIANGDISPTFGNFIIKDKHSITSTIARVAILASIQAKENASKLNLSRIILKHDALYEVKADGSEIFIKSIPKPSKQIAKTFKLK